MGRSRLTTAAQVILYINGKPYAQVTSFRWDAQTPSKAIFAVDSSSPYELAPTLARVQGSIGLLRVTGDGGLEGAGITTHAGNLPRNKYISLALIERGTDMQLFRADRCWVNSQSWDVPVKGRVTGQMAFEAIDWTNETASG